MGDFFENFTSPNAMALIVSSAIFIITVALIAFRLITFVVTCVLLFFAVASGFAIANNDIVREYVTQHFKGYEPEKLIYENEGEAKLEMIRAQLQVIFEQVVEVLSNHAKEHKDNKEQSKQLKTTIEGVLEEIEQQKIQLQELLDSHSSEEPAEPIY